MLTEYDQTWAKYVQISTRYYQHDHIRVEFLQECHFFQITNVFDDSNTVGLPLNANRIRCELFNISIDEIGKLWGNIGANYVPSVCYKFKQILFDGENISQDTPRILGVSKKSSNFFDNIDARDVKNIIDENNNPE